MLTNELQRMSADGRGPQARGLQNRGRSSTDVRPRSLLSTNVHCIDRMTANDSRVDRGDLSLQEGVVRTSEKGWRPSHGFLDRLQPRASRASSMRRIGL
jgi:hypothetical protein